MPDLVRPGESLPRFPWEAFADGRYWRATRGVDFSCSPKSFRAKGWNWAHRKRRRFTSRIDGDTVTFCIFTDQPKGIGE